MAVSRVIRGTLSAGTHTTPPTHPMVGALTAGMQYHLEKLIERTNHH
jgi:hypothetical protein